MPSLRAIFRTPWILAVAGIALVGIGGVAGWYVRPYLAPPQFRSIREAGNYKLISPFLFLQVPESTVPHYLALRSEFDQIIDTAKRDGKITDASVYYRDMQAGQWVAINSTHTFALASMLKVATVMSVLHKMEQDPGTLAARVTLDAEGFEPQTQAYHPPEDPIKAGQTYTVEELMWHDIVESDNNAERALESYVGLDSLTKTYDSLHLKIPDSVVADTNTTQEYSHLFRVLFGATYLSRDNSEALMQLLTKTTYNEGLVAGVPPGTTVAHKFGENVVPVPGQEGVTVRELHDCGIVYAPNKPYFVCVTTKGNDFDTLATVIRDISAAAWKGN